MKDLHETFIEMYEKQHFLSFYFEEINKRGYSIKETQYIKGKLEIIETFINNLSYRVLHNLLMSSSNRRLDKIVFGAEKIIEIIQCPEDYKLVIDLDNLDNDDVRDALVFKDLRQKYCYFQHKEKCEIGLRYINNKWQVLS